MIRLGRWALALALLPIAGFSGCSNQYEDVGAIDVAASKAKSADSGTNRGDTPKKGRASAAPGHTGTAATSSR